MLFGAHDNDARNAAKGRSSNMNLITSSTVRRIGAITIRSLVAVVLVATVVAAPLSAPAAPAGSPVSISVIAPLTGSAAFLGVAEQQALQALQAYVNKTGGIKGRPLAFTYLDDTTNPQVAVQFANQIVSSNSPAFLEGGPTAACNAVSAIVSKSGPVMYCLSPAILPAKGSYAFSTETNIDDIVAVTVRYFRERGWKKLAIITSTDASGQVTDHSLDVALAEPENKDVTVVDREHFGVSDISVAAQVTRMAAAKPDAIIAWATGTPISTVFRQLRDSGVNVPVATTNGNMTYAQMAQYAQVLPKQLYIPAPRWAAHAGMNGGPVKAAQDAYFAAFKAIGIKPDNGHALAYDPGLLVVSALRALGPNASASAVRDWIMGQTGFSGVNGYYDFRNSPQRGLTIKDTVMTRWDPSKGTWVAVSSAAGLL
jgi:branched-chain amino acid transport system substrate-binding protein